MSENQQAKELTNYWLESPRWKGIKRPYSAADVLKLKCTLNIEYTLAKNGSERLWQLMHHEPFVRALGALTGNQAVQQVQSGLQAIYLSGWQVAADANTSGNMYPDQSLYPVDSVPSVVRKINNSLMRADQIQNLNGKKDIYWFAPIVADAEAGFGGVLNAYELMKGMIEAGAAGVHFEDQLASEKKCGHMGGKVLVPTQEFIRKLVSARLASDVLGVPTILIARTDADAAKLITSDVDPLDQQFITGERTVEGFYRIKGGLECCIARGLAYAEYADVLWMETSKPDLAQAEAFAKAIHEKYPGKLLAYNCSPSFNWKQNLSDDEIANFQERLGELGFKFQFVTLAGFHALNTSMFELASEYKYRGMAAYSRLQQREFELEKEAGYSAVKHQSFVGTGYFDEIQNVVTGGLASTGALKNSTEEEQFINK